MVFPFLVVFGTLLPNGLYASEHKVMKFSAPKLSEEEESSAHMPDHLRCDACQAIAYKIKTALEKSRHKLRESEVLDVIDRVCAGPFDEYGLKQVKGESRLAGPGVLGTEVPGIVRMGGKWSSRLKTLCSYYQGEIGEMKMYNAFQHDSDSLKYLICGRRGECIQEMNPKKKNVQQKTSTHSDEL